MVQRPPARISDDRFFPVRVRIGVPEGSFWEQLNLMHGWLNMYAGRGDFAIHSTRNDLPVDAARFYFMDTAVARAFVERFACGLTVVARGQYPRD